MKKILLIIWGESYRSGAQMTRTRGTEDYFFKQQIASKSHYELINKLEKDFKVDIFINTHKLNDKDDKDLLKFYDKKNIIINKFHNGFGKEDDMLNNTYDNIIPIIENYDFILMIRIDLFIKKFLIDKIKFEDKVYFAHINAYQYNINNTNNISISQQIMIYPKKFFIVFIEKTIYNCTHSIRDAVKDKIGIKNIDYIIDSLHLCSTDLEWNPLYIQVGRKINNEYKEYHFFNNSMNKYFEDHERYLKLKKMAEKDINKLTL